MIEINLLPHREAKRAADLRESIALLILGMVLIVGGVLFFNDQVDDQVVMAKTIVGQLESDIEHYKPQEKQVEDFKRQKQPTSRTSLELSTDWIAPGRARFACSTSSPMRTPGAICGSRTSRDRIAGRVKLVGDSLDNGVVADFLRGLNGSEHFENVDLLKTGRGKAVNGVRLVRFEISADLVTPEDEEEESSETEGA